MFARVAPPDRDEDRGFADRFFRLTRLFKGHGRADGDLTPECLAAVQEVLDTLGKKAGPEDDRTAGQRRHDALEEAMRLLLASGCLPERAGQPAQVQLHMTLDELLGMPGADDAARAWLARHLGADAAGGTGQPAGGSTGPAGHPDTGQPRGGGGEPAGHPDTGQPGGGSKPAGHPGAGQPGGASNSPGGHPDAAQPGGEPAGHPDAGQPGGGSKPAGHPDASQPGGGSKPAGHPDGSARGSGGGPGDPPEAGASPAGPDADGGSASAKPDLDEVLWPDPFRKLTRPDPAAARRAAARQAAGTGEPGWLTGKAAEAYACDAKIAPMVCGHLDRNTLARAVTDLLAGDLANLTTTSDPLPLPGPRCACDEHPAARRAPIPGALLSTTALPGLPQPGPTTSGTPGRTGPGAPSDPAPGRSALTPGGLARLQDTLLRYAVSLLSGPTGLAAYLRTQLTSGFFPSASLPLDLGQPTEEVPPHLRRAVIKRDRHCSFPGCSLPPVRCHVHHLIPRSQGGPTRLDNLTLLCAFHHLIVIHRKGWTLTLRADGTTTAKSPDGIRTLHSHGPPPGQGSLWDDRPGHGPPATAA